MAGFLKCYSFHFKCIVTRCQFIENVVVRCIIVTCSSHSLSVLKTFYSFFRSITPLTLVYHIKCYRSCRHWSVFFSSEWSQITYMTYNFILFLQLVSRKFHNFLYRNKIPCFFSNVDLQFSITSLYFQHISLGKNPPILLFGPAKNFYFFKYSVRFYTDIHFYAHYFFFTKK